MQRKNAEIRNDVDMSDGGNADWQEVTQNNPKNVFPDLQMPRHNLSTVSTVKKGSTKCAHILGLKTFKFHFGRVQTELLKHLF